MTMPSDDDDKPGLFDRFADKADRFSSKSYFFAACVLLVIVWAPTLLVVKNIDTWQLLINTPTTVVTFLLVGLAANTGRRANAALQAKLNAIAQALVSVLEDHDSDPEAEELRKAVGLEDRESS